MEEEEVNTLCSWSLHLLAVLIKCFFFFLHNVTIGLSCMIAWSTLISLVENFSLSYSTCDSVLKMTHSVSGCEPSGFDTSSSSLGLKWAQVSYLFLYGASTCKSLYTEVYTSLSGGAWKNASSHPHRGIHFTVSVIPALSIQIQNKEHVSC